VSVVLLTINASNVSLYDNQLHVWPSNVGNAMVGSLMCDWGVALLLPEWLLLEEGCSCICIESNAGCNNSQNLASTWKYWFSNNSLSAVWSASSDSSSSVCAVSYLLNMSDSLLNLTCNSCTFCSLTSMKFCIRVIIPLATALCWINLDLCMGSMTAVSCSKCRSQVHVMGTKHQRPV